jgi:hypothetical protein
MRSVPITPAELQAAIADGLNGAAALKARLDALADDVNESKWPTVNYDDPAWNDPTRWVPTEAAPAGFESDDPTFPFLIAASG